MTKRKLTGNQLGSKVKKLFILIENIDNWEKYVAPSTVKVVKTVYELKNMTEALEKLDMKYTTARAHLMRALERIDKKKLDHLRNGLSSKALELFSLMNTDNWKDGLTDREIEMAETFRETKSFYEAARKLSISPSVVSITLYGNTQKVGVLKKIKNKLNKNGSC